jgi:hypothetical protein
MFSPATQETQAMPPFVIPQLVKFALGAAGAAAAVHWIVKEARRVNQELKAQTAPVPDRAAREALPTLRRDPRTGDWRVM